ncbi:hypothetical protein PIB30_064344 [Stylosanthes scabra]|uniref:Uncharacterized protein n=1 Tax=Stylosanthes scabra TaxID=79078 RepID=A0ABU6ZKD3_9FABA|nr:hypothetical protein [Stylosanthes scabra]
MRMIPTPGSRVQSSETIGSRTQIPTPTQTTTDDDEPPPPEPNPMPWPPVENLCRRGRRMTYLWRRSSLDRLVVSTSTGTAVTVGIRYARARPRSARSLRITTSGLCPSSAWHRITRSGFGGTVGGLFSGYNGDMSTGSTSLGG